LKRRGGNLNEIIMNIREAIIYILKNRSIYGSPVKSERLRLEICKLTGDEISDPILREYIRRLCLDDGILIGGTREGFLIAENAAEAREIHNWISYRVEPLLRHSTHFDAIARRKFSDYHQESLF